MSDILNFFREILKSDSSGVDESHRGKEENGQEDSMDYLLSRWYKDMHKGVDQAGEMRGNRSFLRKFLHFLLPLDFDPEIPNETMGKVFQLLRKQTEQEQTGELLEMNHGLVPKQPMSENEFLLFEQKNIPKEQRYK